MEKYVIVTVAYNRPYAIERLLNSLSNAFYNDEIVDLIISIDLGETQKEIIKISESFEWQHGDKTIIAYEQRLGLREHILRCGDYSQNYDAVIVLEDDVTVANGFYSYAKQSVSFYGNDNHIAGVSLYSHRINVNANRPFEPAFNGYDTYLLQFVQSWGQCWTKRMWSDFREWYALNKDSSISSHNIPGNIASWNDQSWLKYFMKYIVETDKYFVYPYVSLSTNYSDEGMHCDHDNNDYQVPLLEGTMVYRFPHFEQSIKYDVFFERQWSDDVNIANGKKVCMDLYGTKKTFGNVEILFSTQALPFLIEKGIQLKYRPHEINCLLEPTGQDIFMYNINVMNEKLPQIEPYNSIRYDVKSLHWKKSLIFALRGIIQAIKSKIDTRG